MKYNIDDKVNVSCPLHLTSPHDSQFVGIIVNTEHNVYLIIDEDGRYFDIEEDEIINKVKGAK